MAHVGLATAWIDAFWVLPAPPGEALANAKVAAEKALALDEDLAGAHAALAYAKLTWDWPGAEAGFKRALELNPNSASAMDGLQLGIFDPDPRPIRSALGGSGAPGGSIR